mmetsp:Transcript_29700/g.43479  ORF Transcript_29700/g.43479 Transcript_29700/m.43479 type:complete len:188 (+) Transcript_29700:336-899(+)
MPLQSNALFLMAVYDTQVSARHKTIDGASASIRVTGRWARRESAQLNALPADSLFVDVGANVGWHSLVALSLGHRVIAFEALSANVQLINHSLCLNPGLAQRLTLKEVAVTDQAKCTITSSAEDGRHGILFCGNEQEVAMMSTVPQDPVHVWGGSQNGVEVSCGKESNRERWGEIVCGVKGWWSRGQ